MKHNQKSMLAAILVKQKKALFIDRVKLPETLLYGQVLVKIERTSICGSQIGEIEGVKGVDKHIPHLLGHEGGGEVVAIGPGVSYVQEGDRVVLHWKKGRGIEATPPVYEWKGEKLNAGYVTTFNEFAIVSENRLTRVPKGFDLEWASLLGCAVLTGLGIIVNDAQVKIGESVVVIGSGGVGMSVIQGASMVSADPIIAIDLLDNKLELARKFGATHVINAKRENVRQSIVSILGDEGADVVVENTGDVKMIEFSYEATKAQGRSILVGVPRKGNAVSLYSLPLHFGKVFKGSHGGGAVPERDIPRYVHLVNRGKLCLENLITHRYPFEKINDALRDLRSGVVSGRCMLHF